jgi:tripartite ATP-independent transporter DctM subunit
MTFPEIFAVALVVAICVTLMAGYPVAFTLGGISIAFALLGHWLGLLNLGLLGAFPQRVFGVMTNEVLLAIPLFIFMGVMLERSHIAEDLLETMGRLFGPLRGGLGISVVIVGVLLAAAKGVVGATVVTMGLIVLPAMLRFGYDKRLAAGTVAATATLAQIFPPATVLVLLGDQLSNAYQAAQLSKGIFAPKTVAVSDLFAGAIVPGFALVALYILYLIAMAIFFPKSSPAMPVDPSAPRGFAMMRKLIEVLVAPLLLILAVLGSILGGIATPTEAASIGAVGAMLLAARRATLSEILGPTVIRTTQITTMIFVILIGATLFSLVFRGLGGDDLVHRTLDHLPGGPAGAVVAVMIAMFLLGFVMDAFEIIFVVVPIVAPALLAMPGVDPVWLGVMMAVNLQTSYMHPPLGPTLFYLRGVAPPEVTTAHIYVGIIPFVIIQLLCLVVLWFMPALATALPRALYGG